MGDRSVLPPLVCAILLLAPVVSRAATETLPVSEFRELQAQVQALAVRLDELQATNSRLQTENADLKTQVERLGTETESLETQSKGLQEQSAIVASDVAKVKGADWASRVRWRGDFRLRHEHVTSDRDVSGAAEDAADRDRQRIRARFGFDATITDTIKTTMALATGGDDPRASNQTLGGVSSRKTIGLDLAYADWRFMQGGTLLLGKQPYPVWRPAWSYFLDSDVNPEGGAVRLARGPVFANVYGYWLTEQFNSDPDGENSDARIIGLQAGVRFAALGGETQLAANYYECGACKDKSPLYANNPNGNTTYSVGSVNYLTYGYDIIDVNAQVGMQAFGQPLAFTAGYARNLADGVQYDTAWSLGTFLGRASDPGSWELGVLYQSIDKDALFGQIVDSDFGDGKTDTEGWVLKGGYAPVKNLTFATQWFINTLNKDVGTELDYSRLQLDVNYRF
jgi:FtsZ-binding cell division protein ZapB